MPSSFGMSNTLLANQTNHHCRTNNRAAIPAVALLLLLPLLAGWLFLPAVLEPATNNNKERSKAILAATTRASAREWPSCNCHRSSRVQQRLLVHLRMFLLPLLLLLLLVAQVQSHPTSEQASLKPPRFCCIRQSHSGFGGDDGGGGDASAAPVAAALEQPSCAALGRPPNSQSLDGQQHRQRRCDFVGPPTGSCRFWLRPKANARIEQHSQCKKLMPT